MSAATVADVLAGNARWSVEQRDCLPWLRSLPDDSLDLVVTSPPYGSARLYLEDGEDLGIARDGEDWIRWMVEVLTECARACRGLVACVCEGTTKGYRYDCTPLLLAADLHRAGLNLRKPACYFRFGIPGSGGPDWWRNDWEPILCITRPGKLPWSDPAACGHPPKYGPGGEMSNRTKGGARVNQWGSSSASASQRRKNGQRQPPGRPSHDYGEPAPTPLFEPDGAEEQPNPWTNREGMPVQPAKGLPARGLRRPSGKRRTIDEAACKSPDVANPGNVVKAHFDAEEVRQLLAQFAGRELSHGDVVRCLVGGGLMGSSLSHENEAPFPESLVEPFVLSFCPPGGVVCDPFAGSGTTGAVALRLGRRFVGCDVRGSQAKLARQRLGCETPGLPELEA